MLCSSVFPLGERVTLSGRAWSRPQQDALHGRPPFLDTPPCHHSPWACFFGFKLFHWPAWSGLGLGSPSVLVIIPATPARLPHSSGACCASPGWRCGAGLPVRASLPKAAPDPGSGQVAFKDKISSPPDKLRGSRKPEARQRRRRN